MDGGLQLAVHHGAALGVQRGVAGFVQRAVNFLADGGDDGAGGDVRRFAGVHRAAAAGGIGRAQLHHGAGQLAVLHADGGQQLHELHAVLDGLGQLLLVGGHVPLGAAVDQPHLLHAGNAFGGAGGVHGGVAAADDHHVSAQRERLGGVLGGVQEAQHVHGLAVFQPGIAVFPGAHRNDDIGVALLGQFLDAVNFGAGDELRAVGLAQRHVFVDGFGADAEFGDHMPDDAAQRVAALKHRHIHTGAGQEHRRGQAGGAAADDGNLFAGLGGSRFQGGQHRVKRAGGGGELGGADAHRALVVVAHALVGAVVGAEGAGDEGQGVALQNDVQRVLQTALFDGPQIAGNVLPDGAAATAGGLVAVDERHGPAVLAARQRLDGLAVAGLAGHGLVQRFDGGHVHARKGGGAAVHEDAADLAEPVIAAGLQHGGGHGDGPDARVKQGADVARVGAAGVADAQLAVKLLGHLAGQRDGEGVQRPAGHVHFAAGQLTGGHVHREGVGQLDAEFQPVFFAQGDEAAEHGHRVGPLQVLHKVVVVKHDVVKAKAVQTLAGELVAQQGGVALDVGVQVLLGDEVGGNALDLIRRAAVQRALGDGVGHAGGDAVHKGGVHLGEAGGVVQQPLPALVEHGGGGGVLHALDVGVHLGRLDALQIVAHRHVEHETVRVAQTQLLRQHMAGEPRLDVLVKGLGHRQLGGPLAVVALVPGGDAGLVHALGQLLAVHDLDGFQLEEPCAAHIGGHDVLGQLGVGTGGGAVGAFDFLVKNGQRLAVFVAHQLGHAKNGALLFVFGQCPVHQLAKGHGSHDITHGCFLLLNIRGGSVRPTAACSAPWSRR